MSPYLQHTIASPVSFAGVGIHTGEAVRGCVRPAGPDAGVGFFRTDVTGRDPLVPARADRVCQTRLGTVIGNASGVTVSTIEHLMAAFSAMNIDNVTVELDGPEAPIMDGSSRPFVAILDRAGRRRQEARRRYIEVLEPIEAADGDKHARLSPADQFEVAFEIAFETPAIGRQSVELAVDEAAFRQELADCRTFGFLHEVDALRAAGLARGGDLDNVVVIEGDTVLNPEGLRRPDEFVRHKALDAIGDLYLLGSPVIGRYEGRYAGHGLNNALTRAVLATPAAWRYATARQTLAEVG
ncbi:MAG: UDP-3-O-acyl-N-acetylglucosamine deacetylase [Caulobacteraceae bacterium]